MGAEHLFVGVAELPSPPFMTPRSFNAEKRSQAYRMRGHPFGGAMKDKRTHYQLMIDCVDLLEEWLRGIEPRVETHILLEEIQATITKKPGGFAPNPYITQQYEKAKQLVKQGKMIKDACKETGLTLDQWYRRKKMEKTGKDSRGEK